MTNKYDLFLETLKKRFDGHMNRHPNVSWHDYEKRITEKTILEIMIKMEESGGEPDLVVSNHMWYIIDCAKETPAARRNICYDKDARLARKKFPPASSAVETAHEMGIEILTESLYHRLQEIEDFDLKTSSWLLTPSDIRSLGGAIFGDKKFNRTFTYHNGADSYYGSRGFRGYIILK